MKDATGVRTIGVYRKAGRPPDEAVFDADLSDSLALLERPENEQQ